MGASWSARPPHPNEDYWFANGEVCVVLDGAGAPPGLDTGCWHGTAWYVAHLGPAIVEAAANQRCATLSAAVSDSITRVAAEHGADCDLSHPGTPSSTVTVVRHTGTELQYLLLGDSPLVLSRRSGVESVIDHRVEAVERAANASMPGVPLHTVQGRVSKIEFLRSQRNRPHGYWIADADPRAAEHAIVGSVPTSEVGAFAILTDGASRITQQFGALSWQELMAELLAEGPERVLGRVRALESSDPACKRWPRTKVSDDATIVVTRCDADRAPPKARAGRGPSLDGVGPIVPK